MASPDTLSTPTEHCLDDGGRDMNHGDLQPSPRRSAAGPRQLQRASRPLLLDRTARIASELRASGIAAGDRVAISLPPGTSRAASVLAVWHLGGAVVLTEPGLTPRRARQALHDALPAAAIADTYGLWLLRRAPSVRLRLTSRRIPGLNPAALPVDHRLGDALGLPRWTALPPPPPPSDDPDAEAALVIVHDPEAPGEQTGVYYSRTDVMLLSRSAGDRAPHGPAASGPQHAGYPPGGALVRTSSAALLASHLP